MPWRGPTSQWPAKYVKMDPEVKRRFETAARALGMRESEVVDQLVRTWLAQVESQIRLSRFFDQPQPITIHTDRVNVVARKANVLVVKDDLRRAISRLENPPRPNLERLLRDELSRVLQRAARLPPEARDEELRDLVAEAEAYLTMETTR